MGQTLTSSNLPTGRESPSLSSPSTPEPQFSNTRVVLSQDLLNNGDDESSTPSSTSSASEALPVEETARGVNPSSRAPLMMEAFIKTFEQLAVQQWPTWAKRRGWITDYSEESSPPDALLAETSPSGDPTFEGARHTWTFGQKIRSSSTELEAGNEFYTEAEKAIDAVLLNGPNESLICKQNRTDPMNSLKLVVNEENATQEYGLYLREKEAALNLADLYEMTLRWIFEPDEETAKHGNAVNGQQRDRTLSFSEDCSAIKPEANTQALTNIRIYIRLLRKSGTEISFIDFRPSVVPSTSQEQIDTLLNYDSKHDCYLADITKNELTTSFSFPRDVSCSYLISEMIKTHPMLEGFKTEQLAIYEKRWFPGKTSRARLRRLNDLEHPLQLASEWEQSNETLGENNSAVLMTRAMVLQECQTGDISWEEFSLAELNNFLKVLEREEASHEFFIRQKYEHLAQVLNMAIQAGSKKP